MERGGREMRRGVWAERRGEWAVMRFVAAAGSCGREVSDEQRSDANDSKCGY